MIFTTYGRSMMCQACGAMSVHDGDYCSFLAAVLQLVNTGIVYSLHGEFSIWTWKEDASGSSISMRSTAESKGSGRGVSPFHLSPECIRGGGFWLFWWLGVGFCWLGLHPDFLRLGSIGLLLRKTTDDLLLLLRRISKNISLLISFLTVSSHPSKTPDHFLGLHYVL